MTDFDFWRPVSAPDRETRYEKISGHPTYDWSEWRDTMTNESKWIPNKQLRVLGVEKAFQQTWTFPKHEQETENG